MSEMVQYRVKRAFKYNGRWYKQGALWTPEGSRHDASIIRQGLVATERMAAQPDEEPTAGDPDAGQPQMAAPVVEAARSQQRAAKTKAGAEPRPGAGGPR